MMRSLLRYLFTWQIIALSSLAGDPPDVVRLRVPSDAVKSIFPPGTELRGMSRDQFEKLVAAAKDTHGATIAAEAPLLLRTRHHAKWVDGVLLGTSELTLNDRAGSQALVSIAPWSPAIVDSAGALLRADADHSLQLGPGRAGEKAATLTWEQIAKPATNGRSFELALPASTACRLALDLPEGLVPDAPGTIRQGPSPGSSTDRRSWIIDSSGGTLSITLRPSSSRGPATVPAWLSANTRVDLSESPPRWTAECVVDLRSSGSRWITLQLDQGLDPIDVSGPAVASYRFEPANDTPGTIVSIRLLDSVSVPTPVIVRALGTTITEHTWRIPAFRPGDMVWTGGRTLVRLGTGRFVSSVRTLAARQTTPTAVEREFGSNRSGLLFAFESFASGSPAELIWNPSTLDATSDVLGALTLSRSEAPRLDARVRWKIDRGRIPQLAADLPPGWSTEKVQLVGSKDSTSWHAEARPGGGTRLVVHAPPVSGPGNFLTLEITAVGKPHARSASFDLPRVLPVGGRIADESWTLRAEPGMGVAPRQARGLAWLNPATVDLMKPPASVSQLATAVLAWRWTAADARGSFEIGPEPPRTNAEAFTSARVTSNRLNMTYEVSLDLRNRTVTELYLSFPGEDGEPPKRWEIVGESQRELEASRLSDKEAEDRGFSAKHPCVRLVVPRLGRDRIVLRGRSEKPWEASGAIPLLALSHNDLTRGLLMVFVDRALTTSLRVQNLATRDTAWAAAAHAQVVGNGNEPVVQPRPSVAYSYGPESPAPQLKTSAMLSTGSGGVVEEARLVTQPAGPQPMLHRLSLRVRPGTDGVLDIALPAGATLERSEAEGHAITSARIGPIYRFPLPLPASSQSPIEIELDYRGSHASGSGWIAPERPRLSLPCLAFSWSLELPPGVFVEETRGVAALPIDGRVQKDVFAENERALQELDQRVRAFPTGGLTLGSWLKRLDGGKAPIVVDRVSLESAGWGPRTPLPSAKQTSAVELFNGIGLAVSARAACLVISTAPSPRAIDSAAVLLAATTGQDQFDRYQSVARWRGEFTPGRGRDRLAPSHSENDEPEPLSLFMTAGWPGSTAQVRLGIIGRTWKLSLAILIGTLIGCLLLRGSAFWVQCLCVAALLASGIAMASLRVGWLRDMSASNLAAACLAASIWLAAKFSYRGLRRPQPQERIARSSQPVVVSTTGLLMLLLGVYSQAPATQVPAETAAPTEQSTPIIAVLPYDPPLDPQAAATHVILRLADHDRLRSLAAIDATLSKPVIAVSGATHELRREGVRDVRIASGFDLWCVSDQPAKWTFPSEFARDLSATVDGRDTPVRIEEGGETASVEIAGKGQHRLIVKRLVGLTSSAEGNSLRVAVPVIASARVRVDAPDDGPQVEIRSARGRTARTQQIVEAPLGPAPVLDVRWLNRDVIGPVPPRGIADGTILWDIEPAGDRVRARISSRSLEGLERVALSLEKGLLVRSFDKSGTTQEGTQSAAGNTFWTLSLNPPLPAGQALNLELWRPLTGDQQASMRRIPRIELLGVAEFSGLVGVRRPTDWIGRINGGPNDEAVPDDTFAKAWGAFPDATETFAGAARFLNVLELSLNTGPPKQQTRITPSVRVEITPGRLDIIADASVADEGVVLRELSAAIPSGMRILSIEATGLTDWSRPSDDRLRLRFDSESTIPNRTIRIAGWIPVDGDPMAGGPTRAEADVPWLKWLGADVGNGSLEVSGPANMTFRVEGTGIRTTANATASVTTLRSTFAVAANSATGKLRWTTEAASVTVKVQSLITLYPELAEWRASARYSVPAGPCPVIRLRLPAAWSNSMRIELDGIDVTPATETTKDEVICTLKPDRSSWSSPRVSVYATLPRKPGQALAFPDLVPLGRQRMDRAETHIAFVDASGSSTIVEGSSELQEVDTSKWDSDDIGWTPGPSRHVFRVMKEGWALKFVAPTQARRLAEGAVVKFADIEATLDPDGVLWGHASYDLEEPRVNLLFATLPDGCEILASAVDGQTVTPRRDATGRIVIPLLDGSRNAVLVWRGPLRARDGRVPLPIFRDQSPPTLLRIAAPERSTFTFDRPDLASSAAESSVIRAGRDAREVIERIGLYNRGSTRESSNLLAALIRFELEGRTAERAARAEPLGLDASAILAPLEIARAEVVDSLEAAGLEDFGKSAAARSGAAATDPLPSQPAALDPPQPLRLHPIGKASWFYQSEGSSDERGLASLRWVPPTAGATSLGPWLVILAIVTLSLVTLPLSQYRPRTASFVLALIPTAAVWLSLSDRWPLAMIAVGLIVGTLVRRGH